MDVIRQATIESVNKFIVEQQADTKDKNLPDPYFSLITFNDRSSTVIEYKKLSQVSPITPTDYVPDGCTALNSTIVEVVDRFKSGENVMVAIVTDGKDNASKHSRATAKERIAEQTSKGWQFIYLGANVDSFEEAASFGINTNSSSAFTSTPAGVQTAMRQASQSASAYRSMSSCPTLRRNIMTTQEFNS